MLENIIDGLSYVIWVPCFIFIGINFYFSGRFLWKMFQLVSGSIRDEKKPLYRYEGD